MKITGILKSHLHLNTMKLLQDNWEAERYGLQFRCENGFWRLCVVGEAENLSTFLRCSPCAAFYSWMWNERYLSIGQLARALKMRTLYLELQHGQSLHDLEVIRSASKVWFSEVPDIRRIRLISVTEYLMDLLLDPFFNRACIALREYSGRLYTGSSVIEGIIDSWRPAHFTYTPVRPYELLYCDCDGDGDCDFCCDQ